MSGVKTFSLLVHCNLDLYGVATENGYLWKRSVPELRKALRFVYGRYCFVGQRLSDGSCDRLGFDLQFNKRVKGCPMPKRTRKGVA
jgi:hypothetical protein